MSEILVRFLHAVRSLVKDVRMHSVISASGPLTDPAHEGRNGFSLRNVSISRLPNL